MSSSKEVHTEMQRQEAEEEIAKQKKKVETRIEVRGFIKTTKSKSTRGSQGVKGDGRCKRIMTLISGGR